MSTTETRRTTVTPPELAERWGVSPDKIIYWIKSGELRAFDASLLRGRGKPRYLIEEADIEAFRAAREAQPPLPTSSRRRRRTQPDIVRHFR